MLKTRKTLKLTVLAGILTLALWALPVQAYYLELTGSRVSTGADQLITTGAFRAKHGFQIAWHITEASAGAPFHYEYTISGPDGGALGKTLSHWILEVSNPSAHSDFFNFNGIQEPYDGKYVPATWLPTQGSQGQRGVYMGSSLTRKRIMSKPVRRFIPFPLIAFAYLVGAISTPKEATGFTPATPASVLLRTFSPPTPTPGFWCLTPRQ